MLITVSNKSFVLALKYILFLYDTHLYSFLFCIQVQSDIIASLVEMIPF